MSNRLQAFGILNASIAVACGCALMHNSPLPQRLSEAQQERVEYGWARLASIADTLDRATIMDAILLARAWERGVDRLHLVTHKHVGDITVEMESHFDRLRPEQDTFAIRFIGRENRLLREDVFAGRLLDEAISLYFTPKSVEPLEDEGIHDYLERQIRLEERRIRLTRALDAFPTPPEASMRDDADRSDWGIEPPP